MKEDSSKSVQLSAKQVNFYYGDFHALKNINMEIEANTVTAFIGPSGCGKSTFLRLFNRMNDLIDNTRLTGECLIDNGNIYNKSVDVDDLRKKVGMVFQKPNPFPKSIFENVAYGLRVNKLKMESGEWRIQDKKKHSQFSIFNSQFESFVAQRVEESLQAAALWDEVKDKLKKSAFELSGGQQQRLCIARALAVSPSILLMDEPASALDPISTSKIEELIHSLKKDYTIVIVTHNMQQAARVSDKTGFFMLGELIEYDDTKKIFLKPAKEQTQNYITGRFG
ncbi:phosphate ABC transporter ATP-binding protein [Paludibacter sp. 221]|uniref:phosphate ABC transporter ATP-binding protein n=1 Tax=Paludibacter sp. 221 TaxID=2302939 RepID=UPI0013CF876B|nr:phosphate ABC transporter ATP-binding protein [Paludibacter sp. 221]NDV46297.1 phosphate ABC transporter ATP-binding protein [Paludibacter sp. 221]